MTQDIVSHIDICTHINVSAVVWVVMHIMPYPMSNKSVVQHVLRRWQIA